MTAEQFQALLGAQNELTQLRANQQAQQAQQVAETQKALLEKGQIQQAFDLYKGDVEPKLKQATETALKYRGQLQKAALESAVASAFAGVQFVSDEARAQALTIAAAQLETVEAEGGAFVVRQPGTGLPAADFLKAALAGPGFAHFLKAGGQGGSGATKAPTFPVEKPDDLPLAFDPTAGNLLPKDQVGGGLGLRRFSG